MSEQEETEVIVKTLNNHIDMKYKEGYELDNHSVKICISALKKQISKKPFNRIETRYMWKSAQCPECQCGITSRWEYCQNCGQRLEW